ncbi:M48 family metalloprotease, partial [Jatrophihabitans sp.]|uniref:M48 family metalloprotease n=1 Tax=Jatrophihabitans sp. TaxID=1932789 RepID=UPI0030C6ECF4|nr:Zn-dependent protease with chaperone function [Jatrophihabitans sp.]
GVSRQREWLADASSVQFTRQTSGLAGALKKIAGLPEGSVIKDAHAEKQINHMLFGEGARGISQLYATHPPLLDRIRALEPGFDPRSLSDASGTRPDGMAEDVSLGFATNAPPPRAVAPAVTPAALSAKVGTFTPADLLQGAALSAQIPGDIRQAASQASTAVPLLLALLLDRDAAVRANQLGAVTASLGATVTAAVEQLAIRTAQLPEMLRLPVVGIAAPLLTARPSAELATIVATIDTLVAADGAISVFEYCLTHLVRAYIADSGDPQRRSRAGRGTVAGAQGAAVTLLAVIAAAGNADPVAAQHAYEAAIAHLMPAMAAPPYAVPADLARALDGGWAALDALDPRHKQPLIEAVVVAICDDGVLQDAEAQLLRVTCALLHCPLPALLS